MDRNKILITSITLGIIASASAGLIGLTNLLTKDQIVRNEKNKINTGIKEIFGKNKEVFDSESIDIENYKYVTAMYRVKNDDGYDYAIRTDGSNMYGKISLLIGFETSSHGFKGIFVIKDEQTYASTLEEEYISKVNDGSRPMESISCGATYGATLVREMTYRAKSYVCDRIWKV